MYVHDVLCMIMYVLIYVIWFYMFKCVHVHVNSGEPQTLTLQIYPVVTTTAPKATTTTGRMHTCLYSCIVMYVYMVPYDRYIRV